MPATARRAALVAALVPAAAALRWPGLVALAIWAATVAVAGAAARRSSPGSPLRRGWLAAVAAGGLLALPAPDALTAMIALVAALVLLLGVLRAAPRRQGRAGLDRAGEALLAGATASHLLGVAGPAAWTRLPGLLAAGTLVGTAWLLARMHPRGVDAGVDTAPRLLVGGTLLQALAIGAPLVALPGAGPLRVLGLALWALALAHPELRESLPHPRGEGEPVDAPRVLLTLAAVGAGPAALLLGPAAGDPRRVAGGAALAVLAVAHLLIELDERARRAWRSRHDALTGLPTLPLFADRVEQAVQAAARSGQGLAVAFIDLDGFKQVNDRYGHEAGDAVLAEVARRLQAVLRAQDTVARKSGDEFVVLLPGVADPMAAEIVAEKALDALQAPVEHGGWRLSVGASVGLALWPRDGQDADELIRNADDAMYEVKEAGRGQVAWYRRVSTARARLRSTLAEQLAAALGTASLELDYQPTVALDDGRVLAMVASVRWQHPQLGRLQPGAFLPVVAEGGLGAELDRHVLRRATEQAARWRRLGWLHAPVLVHVSDDHCARSELEHHVLSAVADAGLPPSALGLLITEEGLRRGGRGLADALASLAALGIEAHLHGVGRGDAGLARLSAAPIAGLEVAADRLGPGAADATGDAALAIAHTLGLSVVATGATTSDEVDMLAGLDIPAVRGSALAPVVRRQPLEQALARQAERDGHDPAAVPAEALRPGPQRVADVSPMSDTLDGLLAAEEADADELAAVLRRVTVPDEPPGADLPAGP